MDDRSASSSCSAAAAVNLIVEELPDFEDAISCAISKDGELVVSGSRDRTIRLWRVVNGSLVCTFNCNVDVFQVQMTSDKRTIVALGDRDVSRMLIMLKVVIQHK
jgi:WD40 repeat protein